MSLRGIWESGTRKQNGHWQSAKQTKFLKFATIRNTFRVVAPPYKSGNKTITNQALVVNTGYVGRLYYNPTASYWQEHNDVSKDLDSQHNSANNYTIKFDGCIGYLQPYGASGVTCYTEFTEEIRNTPWIMTQPGMHDYFETIKETGDPLYHYICSDDSVNIDNLWDKLSYNKTTNTYVLYEPWMYDESYNVISQRYRYVGGEIGQGFFNVGNCYLDVREANVNGLRTVNAKVYNDNLKKVVDHTYMATALADLRDPNGKIILGNLYGEPASRGGWYQAEVV